MQNMFRSILCMLFSIIIYIFPSTYNFSGMSKMRHIVLKFHITTVEQTYKIKEG